MQHCRMKSIIHRHNDRAANVTLSISDDLSRQQGMRGSPFRTCGKTKSFKGRCHLGSTHRNYPNISPFNMSPNKPVAPRQTPFPKKPLVMSFASLSIYSQDSCPRTSYWDEYRNSSPPPPVPPLPPLPDTAPLRIGKAEITRVPRVNSVKRKPDAPDSVRGMSILSGLDFESEDSFCVEEHANRSSSLMTTPPQLYSRLSSTSTPPSASPKKPAKLVLPNKSVVPAHLATTSNRSEAGVDANDPMLIPINLTAEPPDVCRPYHRPSSRPLPSLPASVYDTSPVILTSALFQSPIAVQGTKFDDGSVMGKYVCGFAFTESAILDWMERHKLAYDYRHRPAERLRHGWNNVLAELHRQCGIWGALVRVPHEKPSGKEQAWCYGWCIVMATNKCEADMQLEKFSRRRMEEVHLALFCKWGVLGRPEWYEWVDNWNRDENGGKSASIQSHR